MARRLFVLGIASVVFFIFLGASSSTFSSAQTPPPDVAGSPALNDWNIILNPKIPGPGDTVTVSAKSFAINLNTANITWYLDDEKKAGGIGVQSFQFIMGAVGSSVVISGTVEVAGLGMSKKMVNFSPASAEPLFVADTYVPPFYKGKALPTAGSRNKAVALFNLMDEGGNTIPNSDVLFTWRKGRVLNQQKSGPGRNMFYYDAHYPRNEDIIEVTVASRDGKQSKSAEITVPVQDTKLVLYEDRPLEGVRYENALVEKFTVSANEATLVAEPYFFTLVSKNNNKADFVWELDNKQISPSPDRKSQITFGRPSRGSGQSYVEISVENSLNYLFQKAKKEILLQF